MTTENNNTASLGISTKHETRVLTCVYPDNFSGHHRPAPGAIEIRYQTSLFAATPLVCFRDQPDSAVYWDPFFRLGYFVYEIAVLLGIVRSGRQSYKRKRDKSIDAVVDKGKTEYRTRKMTRGERRQSRAEWKQRASRPNKCIRTALLGYYAPGYIQPLGILFLSSHEKPEKSEVRVHGILVIFGETRDRKNGRGESNGRVQEHDPGILNW